MSISWYDNIGTCDLCMSMFSLHNEDDSMYIEDKNIRVCSICYESEEELVSSRDSRGDFKL